jgi:hypothetical protein
MESGVTAMKLEFEESINGFQEARRLRMILEHYAAPDLADTTTTLFVQSLLDEIDRTLQSPPFSRFQNESPAEPGQIARADGPLSGMRRLWRSAFGPSRREMLLSRQRQELIERAERAEAMAFEALSETAEVGRQRDRALLELRRLVNTDKGTG